MSFEIYAELDHENIAILLENGIGEVNIQVDVNLKIKLTMMHAFEIDIDKDVEGTPSH